MSASAARRRRAIAAATLSFAFAAPAAAEPNDAKATKLDNRAMNQQYPAAEFEAAKKTLEEAIALCEKDCSASVQSRLHRDLGVVLVGFGDAEGGEREFEAALVADPTITLDPAFITPEIQSAFDRASAAAKPAAEEPKRRREPRHKKKKRKKSEGLEHEPVSAQRINTPVPIYVELMEETRGGKATLHYRTSDQGSFKTIAMAPVGDGLGAEIPCSAVESPGSLYYFVDVRDAEGDVTGSAGSEDSPFEVEISNESPDEPPHWPGRAPPSQCGAAGGARGPSSVFIGVGIAQDVALVSGSDVCTKDSQVNGGFACFRASGSQYHGTPVPGRDDAISAGVALATTRVLVTSHVRILDTVSLALVVGYAFRGGGPQPDGGKKFLPMHAELRAEWWLGSKAFSTLAPFLLVSGGIVQIDASRPVIVHETPNVLPPPNQLDNPPQQTLDAYKKMGASFAAAGAGVYLPFGASNGLVADVKGLFLFPDSGIALEAELGYVLGL